MPTKRSHVLPFSLPLIVACLLPAARPGHAEVPEDRVIRIAELTVDPSQLDAFKAALKAEIEASIRTEPGVLTLYAVSIKDHPEQIRLFEIYRNAVAYNQHLRSPHFATYKERTRHMVKSITLLETDPVLLGTKLK